MSFSCDTNPFELFLKTCLTWRQLSPIISPICFPIFSLYFIRMFSTYLYIYLQVYLFSTQVETHIFHHFLINVPSSFPIFSHHIFPPFFHHGFRAPPGLHPTSSPLTQVPGAASEAATRPGSLGLCQMVFVNRLIYHDMGLL